MRRPKQSHRGARRTVSDINVFSDDFRLIHALLSSCAETPPGYLHRGRYSNNDVHATPLLSSPRRVERNDGDGIGAPPATPALPASIVPPGTGAVLPWQGMVPPAEGFSRETRELAVKVPIKAGWGERGLTTSWIDTYPCECRYPEVSGCHRAGSEIPRGGIGMTTVVNPPTFNRNPYYVRRVKGRATATSDGGRDREDVRFIRNRCRGTDYCLYC